MSEENELKKRYLRKAIEEYEYSFAAEYEKRSMTEKAVAEGTLDLNDYEAIQDVAVAPDGAWVNARVWVPKAWLDSN